MTGWRLIWLITFCVFILIILVLIKWGIRGGTKMVDDIHEADRLEAERDDPDTLR